jgi:hypothetical protein
VYSILIVLVIGLTHSLNCLHDFVWDGRKHKPRDGVQIRFPDHRVPYVDSNGPNRKSPTFASVQLIQDKKTFKEYYDPFSYIIWSSSFSEMATFEEGFLYPLVLLLIGAGITSLLIPWFAKRSENRKKELEIKADIVSKMAEIMGSAIGHSFFIYLREKTISTPAEKEAVDEVVKKIVTDAYKVDALLTSYSSEENIIKAWRDYEDVIVAFRFASSLYFNEDRSDDEKRDLVKALGSIKKYFSDNNLPDFSDDIKIKWERLTTDKTFDSKLWTLDYNLWKEVTCKLSDQGDKITGAFLTSRIKIRINRHWW